MNKLTYVSSNIKKIEEYKSLGFDLIYKSIPDLKEVLSSDIDVITYKTLAVPDLHIIEDTSLNVEGLNIGVNIKFLINQLKTDKSLNNKKLQWKVLLGIKENNKINIAEGIIEGYLNNNVLNPNAFAFDDIFYINNQSLHDLKNQNPKKYNARFLAMSNLMNKKFILSLEIKDIPEWKGKYQND